MACTFTINFTSSAAAIVDNIKGKIESQSGIFEGDAMEGSFSVPLMGSQVAGTYTIAGQQLSFDITDKPFFVGCGQIEKFLETSLAS